MDGNAIILSNGQLGKYPAKTAHGLIRGTSRYPIVAVIDENAAGKDAGEVVDGRARNIPVFASVESCLEQMKDVQYCLIGVATKGGKLPVELRATVAQAIAAGLSIVNGLHQYLSEMPDLEAMAANHHVQLIDIRKPKSKDELHFWTGRIRQVTCPRIAVLGTDCNVGKRTTARFLMEACTLAGLNAQMIYTGQTGWMQGGRYGFILDSTYNDFVSGEIEHAIVTCFEQENPDVIFIEGQSSLRNPSGPCGSEILLSGEAKYVVLQHAPARNYYDDNDQARLPIPPLETEVELIRLYGAQLLAITLNTSGLTKEQALAYKHQYEQSLEIPVLLPLEEGLDQLVPTIQNVVKTMR